MSNLARYDTDALNTEILELPLSEACQKYKDWAQYEDGAQDFGYLTLFIATRIVITARSSEAEPRSFAASNEITEAFSQAYKYDPKSLSSKLGVLLKRNCFSVGISPQLRAFAVMHHACGYSTAQVTDLVLQEENVGAELTPLNFYAKYYGLRQGCRDYLSPQLNYLKKGNPRFPKKHIALWDETRAAHIEAIQHIPMTHPSEQVAATVEHLEKLRDAFDALPSGHEQSRDRLSLTRAIMLTTKELHALTRDPAVPTRLPIPPALDSRKKVEALPATPESEKVVKALPPPLDSGEKSDR